MKTADAFFILLQLPPLFRINYGAVFTPEFELDLRSFINTGMDCRRIPGMTLTVVKGKNFFQKGKEYNTMKTLLLQLNGKKK